MALEVVLVDGHGKGRSAKINGEGEITVTLHAHPPIDEEIQAYPFSQWFTTNGVASGSNDLRVNGATTAQEFYIAADENKDIFIKTISVRIADTGATLSKFGNLTALTNGVSFKYSNDAIGQITIQDEIKSNLDFLRLGLSTAPIGDGSTAFLADLSGAGADAYLPVIDLSQTFGFQWGLRLKKGTNDRLSFFVNDDLSTGLDGFDIKAFGVQL